MRVPTKSVTTNQKGRVSKFTEEREIVSRLRAKDHDESWRMRYHAQVLYYLFRSHEYNPREVQIMTWTKNGGDKTSKFFAKKNNNNV